MPFKSCVEYLIVEDVIDVGMCVCACAYVCVRGGACISAVMSTGCSCPLRCYVGRACFELNPEQLILIAAKPFY